MDKNTLGHTTWECKYYVIFAAKFRRQVIYGRIKTDIGKILRELCARKGIEIIEAELCPDHVHMLLRIPNNLRVHPLHLNCGNAMVNTQNMEKNPLEDNAMMPWNRRELWIGTSQQKFSRIKNLLAENGVSHDVNVRSTSWSGGRGFGERSAGMMRMGEDAAQVNTYYIYVHKYDCEKAEYMIRKVLE